MSPALLDRTDFPLTRRYAYLNSAGMGLVALPVQRRTQDYATEIGTEGTLRFFASADAVLDAPRRAGARLFNADPQDIAIVNSASEPISQLAAWRRPRCGENVVLIDIDHPSPTLPWMRAAEEHGCEIRMARVADDPAALSFDHVARLVDQNTAVISLSHVQWTTGTLIDLTALGELARAHGALLVVDATHSAGVMPIDAPGSGVDMIVTGSFKWLCAYSGTGVCYVRRDLAEQMRPVMVGSRTSHGDTAPPGGAIDDLHYPPAARRLEFGSSAHILRIALASAIEHMLAPGLTAIEAHVQALGERLIEGLAETGATLLSPRVRDRRAGIVTARFDGFEGELLAEALIARGVVTIPRLAGLRFAPHSFNDSDDIDRALEEIRSVTRGR